MFKQISAESQLKMAFIIKAGLYFFESMANISYVLPGELLYTRTFRILLTFALAIVILYLQILLLNSKNSLDSNMGVSKTDSIIITRGFALYFVIQFIEYLLLMYVLNNVASAEDHAKLETMKVNSGIGIYFSLGLFYMVPNIFKFTTTASNVTIIYIVNVTMTVWTLASIIFDALEGKKNNTSVN